MIYALHLKGVVHRYICLENIAVKPPSEGLSPKSKIQTKNGLLSILKSIQIINFDFAFCFKKGNEEVVQTINLMPGRLAPEIEASDRHGYPVDIWGLGKICLELLSALPAGIASSGEHQDAK